MEIKVENVNYLSLSREGNLLYRDSRVDRPLRKTLYSIKDNQLICRHFNLIGLILHLFGYKKEFNTANLTSYLKKNIKTLPSEQNVTQKVALKALGTFDEVKRKFFNRTCRGVEAIAFFKDQSLDVNAYEPTWGQTALMSACSSGDFALAKYLIDQGADLNYKVQDQGKVSRTALHLAMHSPEMIELLIDKGADLNGQDAYGDSGFFLLVSAYILANPNDENKAKLLNLVHKALAKKPNLTLSGRDGDVLEMACKKGHLEIVQLLWGNGAKMNLKPHSFNPYMEGAIKSGNVELVRWLLDQGVSLDYPRKYSIMMMTMPAETPLCSAIRHTPDKTSLEMVQLLLDRGQDPDEKVGLSTPLSMTASYGQLDLVKLLVARGATGLKEALEAAKQMNRTAIVEYLESVIPKA